MLTYSRTNSNEAYFARQSSGNPVWFTTSPPAVSLGGEPWVIATANASIPEPATMWMTGLAMTTLAAAGARRRRRQRAPTDATRTPSSG